MQEQTTIVSPDRRQPPFAFRRAIVIGGGIAGLTVARVLADYVAQVTVVERDQPMTEPGERPGIPQARHPHNLQPQAQRILELFFPGLGEELVAEQAVRLEAPGDVAFYYKGKWQTSRLDARRATLSCSRTLLEQTLYRRIEAHPGIRITYGYEIAGLMAGDQGQRVSGVRLRARTDTAGGNLSLEGDLVVDASGRRSRAPQWLAELGYQPPEEWHIDAHVGYASRLYKPSATSAQEWKMLYVRPTPPEGTRGGLILPLEGNRWHVGLMGIAGDYPPTKEREFLAFAQSLPTPKFHEAIRQATPLGRIHGFRGAANRVRRYDRLPRLLEGFLVGGDAAYALNPLYAQGMTAALMTSQALAEVLEKWAGAAGEDGRGLARQFQERVSAAVEGPWRQATRNDWHWAGTEVHDNADTLLS